MPPSVILYMYTFAYLQLCICIFVNVCSVLHLRNILLQFLLTLVDYFVSVAHRVFNFWRNKISFPYFSWRNLHFTFYTNDINWNFIKTKNMVVSPMHDMMFVSETKLHNILDKSLIGVYSLARWKNNQIKISLHI